MICTCEPRMISRPFTRTKFGRERRVSGLRMSVNSSREALRVSAIRLYRKKSRGNSRKLWYSVLTQARVAELADAEVSKTFVERRVSSSLTSGTKKSKLSREEGFFHMDVPSHERDCDQRGRPAWLSTRRPHNLPFALAKRHTGCYHSALCKAGWNVRPHLRGA